MSVAPRLKAPTSLQLGVDRLRLDDAANARVLIVDDSRIDAERSRMELIRAEVSSDVQLVSDMRGLEDALRSFVPDAVICELQFADVDGFEAQRIVRAIAPNTPLIFVSASSSADVGAEVAQSGAADYVPKSSLFRLPGAVRQAVREARENTRVDTALGTSSVRSRQHVERLEALWRLVNDADRRGDDVAAVLEEAVTKIGNGQTSAGLLGHVDGAHFIIDACTGDLSTAFSHALQTVRAGMSVPIGDVIDEREIAAGRTTSCEDVDDLENPLARVRGGFRRQITTQFTASGATYVLMFGSLDTLQRARFSSDDYAYVEAVGAIVARHLERRRHDDSIRDANLRSLRHAERLEALWRIFNSTSLRGDELVIAMLREGSAAMRPQQKYGGTLGHVEGEYFVLDAIAGETGPEGGPARRFFTNGLRAKLSDSLIGRDLAGGRTKSWDDCFALPDCPAGTRAMGIRTQITTQFVANDTLYLLSLGSLEPQTAPFSSEDHEYIEVLASMFARQLELEAMESSLRDAELRSREHAQRLDAFWRVVSNPDLRGSALVDAMLHEAAGGLRYGQAFVGTLRHVEGSEYVIDALAGDLGERGASARRLLAIGTRIPFDATIPHGQGKGRTQSWQDVQTHPDLPARVIDVGWRSAIATTFEAAGKRYELTVGSLNAPSPAPFSSEDEEYIEVLASVLARQFDLEHMEDSLSASELRTRQHAERLEALWRIAGDASLKGEALILAMLQHGAAAIRPSQGFLGALIRVEGDEIVVIAEGIDPRNNDPRIEASAAGRRIPLARTLVPLVGRTRAWDDLATLNTDVPPMEVSLGWRALIATTFETGGERYLLGFSSPDPTTVPFGTDDEGYLEVLASTFANELQVNKLEGSLRDEEDRSLQHAERLEALWKIVNNSSLRDEELVLMMLQQAAAAIVPGQDFEALLMRVQGDDAVIEAVTSSINNPGVELHTHVGAAVPLANTSFGMVLAEGGGTHSWHDLDTSAYSSDASRARGTRSLVITTFVAGTTTWGLAFTSTRTIRKPLGAQDHAYVEVLASFFANHLQQRWQFDRIQYQQSHDVLTGLLNRSTFRSRARMDAQARERYAIVIVDIDGLHEINESFGHIIGDAVLVEVGNALRQRVSGDAIVGRLGGDVFGIYLPDVPSREYLFARVHDIGEVFSHGFSTGDRDGKEYIARTACIGVAAAPEDGTHFESILSHADAALFTAQERGHGSMVFYVAGMEAEAQRRATLQNELREAIDGDQFTLYFQPHVEIKTGRVTGCEALIRWNHPARGVVLPNHFIPFAEQTGIITSIDAWVMKNAFAAAGELAALRPGFRLYFNLSGRQAGDSKVVRAFTDAARSGLALENIGVEITETDAMRDVDRTRHVCRALPAQRPHRD